MSSISFLFIYLAKAHALSFFLICLVPSAQIYGEQDTSKMPLELGSALSIERESIKDPEIRVQALEAIYLIVLQVKISDISFVPF